MTIVSCKSHTVKIISFEANQVVPGRAEQNAFTSYTLKFVNQEKKLEASSIQLVFNDKLEITPVQFNNNSNTQYNMGDTVHCAFSIQNKYLPNQSYILKYSNTKKVRLKKLSQPLFNNTNIPKQ